MNDLHARTFRGVRRRNAPIKWKMLHGFTPSPRTELLAWRFTSQNKALAPPK